ncbi:MAG: SGNH/GDSL hydrolase family protein [Patescibacteria group bacterium]
MSEQNPPVDIVFGWGDSIAKGFGADFKQGWMQRLEAAYYDTNRRPQATFYNLSVPGETCESFYRRVQNEASSRQGTSLRGEKRHCLSVVSLGGQDIFTDVAQGRDPAEVRHVRKFFVPAVQTLLKLGDVLYVGIPPCNEERIRQRFARLYNASLEGINRRIWTQEALLDYMVGYSARVTGPQRAYEAVSLMNEGGTPDNIVVRPELISPDGEHPNQAGHDWIYRRTLPVFNQLVAREIEVDSFVPADHDLFGEVLTGLDAPGATLRL